MYSTLVNARRSAGDPRVAFYELPELPAPQRAADLAGCHGHYTAEYHTRIAAEMTAMVQAHTGWSVTSPIVATPLATPVQTGDIAWGAASCTLQAGASAFTVSITGLSAGVLGEFSIDNSTWQSANIGTSGFAVSSTLARGGVQSFWARPKGYPSKAIWGALVTCN